MYCNRCGAEVTPGAAFCSECGAPMVQEGGLQQNQTEQATPFPMKWHKALIYCFLFLGAAISAINAIMVFSGSHYQGYADMVYGLMPKLKTVDTIMGILCLGGIAVALITRQKLAGFKRGAPNWVTLVYVYNGVLALFYPIAANAVVDIPGLLEESFSPSTIISFVGIIVAVVCNRIYYNKRASLFVN